MLILAALDCNSSGIYREQQDTKTYSMHFGLNVSLGTPEEKYNLCWILKTVMKIVPKFLSQHLVKVIGEIKTEKERKKIICA
jgi:hypothetical protein